MKNKKGDSRSYFELRGLKIPKSKRSLEMAINMVIITTIAILVLIGAVIFLTGGFKTFKEKINAYTGSSNIDILIQECNKQAEQQQSYEYCCVNKEFKINTREKIVGSCSSAGNYSWAKELINVTCEGVC